MNKEKAYYEKLLAKELPGTIVVKTIGEDGCMFERESHYSTKFDKGKGNDCYIKTVGVVSELYNNDYQISEIVIERVE